MGRIYTLSCRNKKCRYSFQVRESMRKRTFMWMDEHKDEADDEKKEVPGELVDLLLSDDGLIHEATYLCSICKEYQNGKYPHSVKLNKVTPLGTIRDYEVHYSEGEPKCKKCGNTLEYILNPRSSKNKCPKCGTDAMRVGSTSNSD